MAKISIHDVNDYIIHRVDEAGMFLNVLKLHKLLYYCQAWHLAFERSRLFDEPFQAWIHGPVSRTIYDRYVKSKSLYSTVLPSDAREDFNPHEIKGHARQIVNAVLEKYGVLTGDQLEELTHRERPWLEAREGVPEDQRSENIIKDSTMQDCYGERIKRQKSAKS